MNWIWAKSLDGAGARSAWLTRVPSSGRSCLMICMGWAADSEVLVSMLATGTLLASLARCQWAVPVGVQCGMVPHKHVHHSVSYYKRTGTSVINPMGKTLSSCVKTTSKLCVPPPPPPLLSMAKKSSSPFFVVVELHLPAPSRFATFSRYTPKNFIYIIYRTSHQHSKGRRLQNTRAYKMEGGGGVGKSSCTPKK